jgi:hypothetical protein
MKPQKLAALALSLTLVLGACGKKTKTTQGKTSSSPSAGVTSAPSSGASTKPKASSTAPASTQTGTTPKPGSSSTSSSPLPTKGSPLAANALKPVTPGRYTYDETGSLGQGQCSKNGPPPTPTTLDVSPADGNRQTSVRDRAFNSGGVKITAILEYRPEGIFLIYLKQEQKITVTNTNIVSEFRPGTPPMVATANPTVGQTWDWSMTSTDGSLTVMVHNAIDSINEASELGDHSQVPTVKSTRHTHITGTSQAGAVDLTEDATAWGSTAKSLIVEQRTIQKGSVGLCTDINNNVKELLKSTTPT